MVKQPLYQLASHFKLLKLKVFIQLEQDAIFPVFKGSMLHGWFGHALKQADENAFSVCYGQHSQQQPKPYIVCPSNDHKTHWQKGEIYSFELSLFGDPVSLKESFLTALKLGESMGLGAKRIPFKVVSICTVTVGGLKVGAHIQTLAQLMEFSLSQPSFLTKTEMALNFQTPIRLKHSSKIVKDYAPSLDFWLNTILRRLSQLSRYWVADDEDLLNEIYNQRPVITNCKTTSHCYFEDWQRYSIKEQAHLPFGGLIGQVSFFGEISHALPILKIGELLHIGGKTTFGLGKYQLIE